MKKLITSSVLCCLLLFVVGCAGKQPIHPGSGNQFDSTTADVLADTQNVLEGLSAKISDFPKALKPVNDARAAYTIFKNDYLLWRCSQKFATTLGPGGEPCPNGVVVTQAQVQTDQTRSAAAISAAQTAEGGKP